MLLCLLLFVLLTCLIHVFCNDPFTLLQLADLSPSSSFSPIAYHSFATSLSASWMVGTGIFAYVPTFCSFYWLLPWTFIFSLRTSLLACRLFHISYLFDFSYPSLPFALSLVPRPIPSSSCCTCWFRNYAHFFVFLMHFNAFLSAFFFTASWPSLSDLPVFFLHASLRDLHLLYARSLSVCTLNRCLPSLCILPLFPLKQRIEPAIFHR